MCFSASLTTLISQMLLASSGTGESQITLMKIVRLLMTTYEKGGGSSHRERMSALSPVSGQRAVCVVWCPLFISLTLMQYAYPLSSTYAYQGVWLVLFSLSCFMTFCVCVLVTVCTARIAIAIFLVHPEGLEEF